MALKRTIIIIIKDCYHVICRKHDVLHSADYAVNNGDRHKFGKLNNTHAYTMSPKTSTFYFLNNCVKNCPILMIFGALNPDKIGHEDLICPPDLSYVATLPWEIQKSHFQQYYSCIPYFWLFTLAEKKTNSNCCTAALDFTQARDSEWQ